MNKYSNYYEETKEPCSVRRAYVKPVIFLTELAQEGHLLAGSPQVKPGQGGTGTISVTPLTEDNEDGDLSGAKGTGFTFEEE